MSLHFRYKLIPVGHPVVPIGGRWVRPRPLVAVTVIGPTQSRAKDALLDTAADDTVFSEALAAQIGLDLTSAPVGVGTGVALGNVPLRSGQVNLRLTDGHEVREWPAWLDFTAVPLPYPMVGFAGCLQFFLGNFYGDGEEVELTVNSLYPGT